MKIKGSDGGWPRAASACSSSARFLAPSLCLRSLPNSIGISTSSGRARSSRRKCRKKRRIRSAPTRRATPWWPGDAEVEWLVRFTKCGHETAIEPAGGVAGKTRKEIATAYPDYAIEIFDTAYVRIVKSAESYCPAHYTLSMGEDALVITKTDVDTLAPKEVMRIIADTSLLDEEALAALAAGVTFDSLEDINAYLEGAE